MKIIVGLGNPGQKYQYNRHNAGFLIIDELANALSAEKLKFEKKFNAAISQTNHQGEKILLLKPQTYMNNSGQAVFSLMNFYKLLPKTFGILNKKNADLSKQLVVIHDDIDFNLGEFKMQKNRSSAGHNGIKSIIDTLKTQNFTRAPVGVRTERKKNIPTDKFVLENFSTTELELLKKITPRIIKEIL